MTADTFANHAQRIFILETWKIAADAIADYRSKHERRGGGSLNKELIKSIGIALGIISTLVLMLGK